MYMKQAKEVWSVVHNASI